MIEAVGGKSGTFRVFGYPVAYFLSVPGAAVGGLGAFGVGVLGAFVTADLYQTGSIKLTPQVGVHFLKLPLPFTRRVATASEAKDGATPLVRRYLPIPAPFAVVALDLGLFGCSIGFGLKTG